MIQKFCLPELGENIDRAVILSWLKPLGERVSAGEALLEITVDKVTFELPSPCDGVLKLLCAREGDLVPCGTVLAVFGEEGDEIPEELRRIKYPQAPKDEALRYQQLRDTTPQIENTVELSAMRTVVADRMIRSKNQVPHFYLQSKVDMSACVEFRQKIKKTEKWRVSYNNMIIKACGLALRKYPQVAAIYNQGKYVMREEMNVGFVVALPPDGLVIPVVREVDKLPLQELCRKTKELVDKANNNRLLPEDFTGGVLTVSNLGGMGVDFFTAIINPGESAILAIGDIIDTPVVRDGEIAIRPMMNITLSSDHRTVDGMLAAHFCAAVKKNLENPELLLKDIT